MTEQWKSIVGYEGLYEVSNWGHVRSLGRWVNGRNGSRRWIEGCVLRPGKVRNYLQIDLYKEGTSKHYLVNRLVAEAFLPNPNNLPEVNHKDENKENNRVDNLEWCTSKYNINYGSCIERRVKARSKTVYQKTLDGQLVKVWSSTAECDRNGFCHTAVSACCNGQRKTHKGFLWSYNPPA